MKLIYRGLVYEYDPTRIRSGNTGEPVRALRHTQAPYELIYRGQRIQVDPETFASQTAARPDRYNLIYRGMIYSVVRNAEGKAELVAQSTDRVTAPVAVQDILDSKVSIPPSLPRRYIGKIHQANLLENLQRRLQVARERGDQKLIELLEAERQQIIA